MRKKRVLFFFSRRCYRNLWACLLTVGREGKSKLASKASEGRQKPTEQSTLGRLSRKGTRRQRAKDGGRRERDDRDLTHKGKNGIGDGDVWRWMRNAAGRGKGDQRSYVRQPTGDCTILQTPDQDSLDCRFPGIHGRPHGPCAPSLCRLKRVQTVFSR